MLSPEEVEILARAYQEAEDAANDPRIQDMVRSEAARVHRAFERLQKNIDIQFVDHDPYQSFEEMTADVIANRRMLVWKGASETPLWDPVTNWMARATHDWDHIVNSMDFTIEGEVDVFRKTAQRMPGLAPLYLSEIVLQAAVQTHTGDFEEQKLVLPAAAKVKAVKALREKAAARGEPTQTFVWYATGMLEFMSLPELMVHLRAQRLGLEEALVVADAAAMLHERRL